MHFGDGSPRRKVKAKVHQAVRDQIGGLVVDVLTERMAGSRGHLEEELESAGVWGVW